MWYRKKPVVIEAVEFVDTPDGIAELSAFLTDQDTRISYGNPDGPRVIISTLEGVMEGNVGDYIIKGVNGEFYPCKPDIFHKTYEPVMIDFVKVENGEIKNMTPREDINEFGEKGFIEASTFGDPKNLIIRVHPDVMFYLFRLDEFISWTTPGYEEHVGKLIDGEVGRIFEVRFVEVIE